MAVDDYLHGCVRLSESDARTLFEWAPLGTPWRYSDATAASHAPPGLRRRTVRVGG